MADDIKTAPVDLGVSAPAGTSAPTQAPQQSPITAGKVDLNSMNTDLADLTPVAGTEKMIAPNSTDDLTPVEGTEKNLAGSAASRFMDRIKANAKGMTVGLYHAFSDPATETELRQLKEKSEAERNRQKDLWKNAPELTPDIPDLSLNPSRVTLAWHRLVDAPADELQNKSLDEAANAKELWEQGHRWKAVNQYTNASADTALAAIPMMGPFINDIAQRAESGDVAGAAGDLTFAIAAEHAPGKVLDLVKGDARLLAEAQKNHARARTQYELRASEADAAAESARQAAAELQKTKDAVSRGQAQPSDLHDVQSRASEATSNLRKANEALKDAQQARGNAVFEEKRLSRRVADKQTKVAAEEAEKFKSQAESSKGLIQKAVPAKGTDFYEPDENGHSSYDVVRAHLDAAKEAGQPVETISDSRNAAENARQEIEDKVMQYREKYAQEPLTDQANSPKNAVTQKLQEMAKVDGNFEGAEDYLNDFNVTDPTVSEGADLLTKLNDHLRQMKKSSNNWDIYNQIQTNPKFAAYYFLADSLRDALYDKFESKGIQGIRPARAETAALIDFRNMADAQLKRNAGGAKVRGSAAGGKLSQLIGRFTKKAVKGGAVMAGAKMGGPEGAVIGYGVGEELGQAAENAISPGDLTRDEHVAQAMKTKGTKYKPVEIKGEGGEPVVPRDAMAPAVKDTPQALDLTPRENTDLHAKLASYYRLTDPKEFSYQELEDRFRQDLKDKESSDVEVTPKEEALLEKILQADFADEAIRKKAATAKPTVTPEEESKIAAAAKARAEGQVPPGVNPHLMKLGRGDESALVSHSPASKAHAPAQPVAGLGEGLTSEDAHMHEWAHVAADAIDHTGGEEGPTAMEIRTDKHPKSQPGTGASAVFDASDIKDASGNVDPEKLQTRLVKWLTNKMAGPASHEVFRGMTKEDAMKHPATRSDINDARYLIRQVDPDLTPKQVEEQVDAAYERMRGFLSQSHVADRIRANAAVREEGLPETHHASRGRVEQFQRDILEAHNEHTGSEGPEPDGGPTGEGGEKAAQSAEGEKKNAGGKKDGGKPAPRAGNEPVKDADGVAESKISKSIPPERTTGNVDVDRDIKTGGGIPGGTLKGDESIGLKELSMFHDPTTGTTLALKTGDVTPERVAEKLRESRAEYAKYETGGKDIGESNINHAKVLENIKNEYGVSTNPKEMDRASFITPEGDYVHLPAGTAHTDAIERLGGEKSTKANGFDNRKKFMNETGTVRIHKSPDRSGPTLHVSVPKDGVTPEQAEAIAQSYGQAMPRNSNLRVERADISPENKETSSADKEFARASDVKPLLRQIKGLKDTGTSNIEKSDVATGADQYNEQRGLPAIDATPKPHNSEFAKRIADAYDAMKHDPTNPEVQKSYQSMANEVQKQWDFATQKMGVKFEPWQKEGQPYANSKEMVNDVRNNKHLYFFQGGDIKPESPMAQVNPKTGLSYNDMFRAVHDLFGHAAHEFEFGPKGEENAYLVHRQMFPPDAIPALTSETRGQNSWVNFGKHLRDEAGNVPKKGEEGYVAPANRPYAEQKVGLLPSELHGTGPLDIDLEKHPAGGINPTTGSMESKRYGLEIHPEDREVLENKPTASDFQRYADEHQYVLKQHPDLKIGWDTLGDKPELNIGISTDNLDAAKKVAAKLDQRSVWDTQKQEEIPAGGKNTQREFPDYPLEDRLKDIGESAIKKSPKGSSAPLMDNPLEVKPGKGREEVNTLDLTKALNEFSRKQLPALEPGSEPKEMVARAKKIAEDEAKYQLAQSKTGTEWYTTEMKDHDKVLQELRPELAGGETTDEVAGHPTKLTLFKAAEAILSSGQKPYANVKSALKAWDAYNETGEFPRSNPATGKEGMSWGPRNVNAYGNAFDSLNKLIQEKGEKGAADWLLSEHPVKELRSYQSGGQSPVAGKATDMQPGAMILGAKRGPFMQNLHGIESKFTADMWVSRSWNRWMGTLDLDPRIEDKGKVTSESDVPRNDTERKLMKESFEKTATKLNLSTSSLQAVLWYYEQALYRAHGLPVESWSFSDAAKRVAKETNAAPEAEQTGFNFGENEGKTPTEAGGLAALRGIEPKTPGAISAGQFLTALKK